MILAINKRVKIKLVTKGGLIIFIIQPNQRIKCPMPTRELERRWRLVRQAMSTEGIDVLVMQNDNQFLGGYIRYFMDIPALNAYPVTLLFPLKEEMTVINHGGSPVPPAPPDYASRGLKNKIGLPYLPTLNFTNSYAAEAALKNLNDLQVKRVGFVGLDLISATFYTYLKDNLVGVEFVDATNLVDEIKAIKSEDELYFIRRTVEIHDYIASAMPTFIRPGRYEFEIRSEIQKILVDLGSEEQLIMMGSEATGKKTPQVHSFYQNRRINEGDQIFIMIEANGPGGYYCELGRTWCLDEPSKELINAWEVALQAQKLISQRLVPGASPAELYNENNKFLISKGYPPEGRLFAHGQGYDLVERPAFVTQETMTLKEGMYVALHPVATCEQAHAFCCDNFIITKDGAERIQKTEQTVFVL